jgi:hypothetical protein
MEYGIWNMEYGIWNMKYGIWNMKYEKAYLLNFSISWASA